MHIYFAKLSKITGADDTTIPILLSCALLYFYWRNCREEKAQASRHFGTAWSKHSNAVFSKSSPLEIEQDNAHACACFESCTPLVNGCIDDMLFSSIPIPPRNAHPQCDLILFWDFAVYTSKSLTYLLTYLLRTCCYKLLCWHDVKWMALNGLYCADVPLSNYSLTHSHVKWRQWHSEKTVKLK